MADAVYDEEENLVTPATTAGQDAVADTTKSDYKGPSDQTANQTETQGALNGISETAQTDIGAVQSKTVGYERGA